MLASPRPDAEYRVQSCLFAGFERNLVYGRCHVPLVVLRVGKKGVWLHVISSPSSIKVVMLETIISGTHEVGGIMPTGMFEVRPEWHAFMKVSTRLSRPTPA